MTSVSQAYDLCLSLTRKHYENYPVISRFIPERLRGPTSAIYAFARVADDYADEGQLSPETRRELLQRWRERLQKAAAGERVEDPIFIALADTLRRFSIPTELLDDLIKAYEMDTQLVRYETFTDVLGYCRYSANPVGRLVLWLHGYRDEALFLLSDCICSALQLANFWQDTAIDLKKNRVYYPQQDLQKFKVTEQELFEHRFNKRVRQLVAKQVKQTQELFHSGAPLMERVKWPLSFHLKLTWLGGYEITKKIEKQNFLPYDRPVIDLWDKLRLVWHASQWKQEARISTT